MPVGGGYTPAWIAHLGSMRRCEQYLFRVSWSVLTYITNLVQ